MMLHRHFEAEQDKNMTRLEDVTPTPKKEEAAPPEEAPKRRGGRPKKTEE